MKIQVLNQNSGILIYGNSDNNTIVKSRIINSSESGIYLDENGGSDPEYNLIYDNYFNNSGTYGNIRIDTTIVNKNYFNTLHPLLIKQLYVKKLLIH